MSTTTLPRLLIPSEVADWLAMPVRRVERLARRGELPAVTLPGGELVFDAADLDAWLSARKAPGRGEVANSD
jgi:excisionase family DNA binding protein